MRRLAPITISACTLLCVLHLLVMQLKATAPLRGTGNAAYPARVAAAQMQQIDTLILRAADGHNLQLQFDARSMLNPKVQNMLTLLYFRSVYTLFPHRVFVGHGDQVINSGSQLAEAGETPGANWLAAHDVKTVLSLGVGEDGALTVGARPAAAP